MNYKHNASNSLPPGILKIINVVWCLGGLYQVKIKIYEGVFYALIELNNLTLINAALFYYYLTQGGRDDPPSNPTKN